MRKYNDQNTKPIGTYLYFKGKALQDIIKNNVENLLLTSSENNLILSNGQTNYINMWIDYYFNRIGEVSAFGNNTIVRGKNINLDFVMKVQNLSKDKHGNYLDPNKKFSEIENEFKNGIIINGLRDTLPNFMTTYGEFRCHTTNPFGNENKASTLCDGKATNDQYGYLLLENVKDSNTFEVNLSFTDVPSTDGSEILDSVFQILLSVYIANRKIGLVHRDLHCNNILQYDFIRNKEFLSQFPIYDKNNPISKAYFKYYRSSSGNNEGQHYYIVPAKYLYVLIDYGRSIVNPVYKGQNIEDSYVFLSNLFIKIYSNKPYLLKNDTPISQLYYAYMLQYRDVFEYINTTAGLGIPFGTIYIDQLTGQNHTIFDGKNVAFFKKFYDTFPQNMIADFFWTKYFNLIERNLDRERQAGGRQSPFFIALKNGEIGKWIKTIYTLYAKQSLPQKLQKQDVFVFNWGEVPQGTIIGIQPNDYTIKYIHDIIFYNHSNNNTLKKLF
jgi:hypothetical protein